MNTRTKAFTFAIGALLATASSTFATPNDGSLGFGVSVRIDPRDTVNGSDSSSWSVVPATLTASATASDSDDNGRSGTAFGNGRATWAADGNSGLVSMQFGWENNGSNAANTNNTPSNWSYTFTADADGTFVMNYEVVGSGDLFGLWGFGIIHNFDSGSGDPVTNPFDPNSSGQFVGVLTSGQSYTVYLSNNGNIFSEGGLSNTGSAQGTFDWSITGAEQPAPDGGATLAMLGGAIAGMALFGRRLRK